MAKRRIHLTEGQLRRLIEQSLNELDPRTYMNAARKRAQQVTNIVNKPESAKWLQSSNDVWMRSPVRNKCVKLDKSYQDLADMATKGIRKRFDPNNLYQYRYDTNSWHNNIPQLYSDAPVRFDGTANGRSFDNNVVFGEPIRRYFKAFQNNKSYYDRDLGRWLDLDDKEFDPEKNKQFWKEQGFGESIARRVTENVIRKLRRI